MIKPFPGAPLQLCHPPPTKAPCGTPPAGPRLSPAPPGSTGEAVGGCIPPKVLLPGGWGSSAVGGPGGAPTAPLPAPPGPLQLLTDTTKPTRTRGKTTTKKKGQRKSWGGLGGSGPPQCPAAPTICGAWHKIFSSQPKKDKRTPKNPKSGPKFGDEWGTQGGHPSRGRPSGLGGVHQPCTPMGWGPPCHHCSPPCAPTLLWGGVLAPTLLWGGSWPSPHYGGWGSQPLPCYWGGSWPPPPPPKLLPGQKCIWPRPPGWGSLSLCSPEPHPLLPALPPPPPPPSKVQLV